MTVVFRAWHANGLRRRTTQVDPALAPLIEAGEGESEGFELAEADLIEHAEHGDMHSTDPIMRDAAGVRRPPRRHFDDDDYAEADEEGEPDW